MARSARTVLARLLPWAALAVMTVFFFVQVRARERAEGDARAARRARPAAAPAAPAGPSEADARRLEMLRSEIAARTSELDRARQDLEAARAERDALRADLERSAAERAARADRAAALASERDAWRSDREQEVAALAARLAEAERLAARRTSGALAWLEAVEGSDPKARAEALGKARGASREQQEQLRAVWLEDPDPARIPAFAALVGTWEPGEVASGLAGQLLAAIPDDVEPGPLFRTLEPHLHHPQGMEFLLGSPSARVLREALPWLDPATVAWSEDARAGICSHLRAWLGGDDPARLELAAAGLGRLGRGPDAKPLAALLERPEPEVRLTAAWAIARLLGPARARPIAARAVAALLDAPARDLRVRAIHVARLLLGEAGGSGDPAAEARRLRERLLAGADG